MKKIRLIIVIILAIIITIPITFKIWVNHNKNKQQIPVLMYHEVKDDEYYEEQPDTIKLSTFEKQLQYLKENDYNTLTLEEFYCWKQGKCDISDKSVLLTFDDGFYSFHYLVEPLLEKYNFHAVNFVIGSTVSEKTKKYNPEKYGTIGLDVINKHSEYVDYQSHSFGMHSQVDNKQKIYSMNKDEMVEDLNQMANIGNFEYISYPYNTDTDEFIEILKDHGYKLAFRGESEKVTKDCNNYQIPRIGVSDNLDEFKAIFETKKHNNRYGNGFLRKVFITIERKFKIKIG